MSGDVTFVIPEGYLGDCAVCGKREATHEEWCEFTDPSPSLVETFEKLGLPAPTGIWHFVCDGCCDPNKHTAT